MANFEPVVIEKEVFFLHRIRHYWKNETDGWVWDKGIEVKDSTTEDNYEAAKQAYHAYLGAYAYGHDKDAESGNLKTDYVACYITNLGGNRLMREVWDKLTRPEPVPPVPPEEVSELAEQEGE